MYSRRLVRLILAAIAVVGLAVTVVPAQAWEGDEPPVEDDGNDLVGNIGEQINTLNDGRSTDGYKPPSCEWTDDSVEPAEVRDDGEMRWRLTAVDQETWGDIDGGDISTGTYYRYECWHDDMECGEPLRPGDDGCYGELSHEGCGETVCYFDAISPSHLSLYAVDQFVESLAPPEPRFSPPDGLTYVNFDTWMWVENIPDGGVIDPPTMQVPGFSVETTATLDSVQWEMGDGGEVDCALTVDEASAEDECTHQYTRSSASQPGGTYTGTASTVWRAEWYVPEFDIDGTVDAPRSTDFNLEVAEVQTVVDR